MIIVFDTETTGFPNPNLPLDHADQPHIVQLACILFEDNGTERSSLSVIVNPGVPIPERASAVHGITDEVAERCGIAPFVATAMLFHMIGRADLVVAHNAPFDAAIARTAFRRCSMVLPSQPQQFCTMRAATPVLNLPPTERMRAAGFTKPKAPKLAECIRHFFGEDLDGAHDALVDVRACARVYFHLRALEAVAA